MLRAPVFIPQQWDDINNLLPQIARFTIANNLYRQGKNFYDLDTRHIMPAYVGGADDFPNINDGYVFLDDPNGKTGIIRLYADIFEPKWSFWIESDGQLKIDWA